MQKFDEKAMLNELGLNSLDDLFSHLGKDIQLGEMNIENGLSHEKLKENIHYG